MDVLGVSTSAGIKRLERMMLRDADCGRANPRCTNVGPGGEGVTSAYDRTVHIIYMLYMAR